MNAETKSLPISSNSLTLQIHKHDPPNDPELLAYYAAHERSEVEHPGLGAQLATEEAAGIDAVEAAVAKVGCSNGAGISLLHAALSCTPSAICSGWQTSQSMETAVWQSARKLTYSV